MKILHTDKDEKPAIELPAEQFLNTPAAAVIDLSTGEPETIPAPVEKKKNNGWIWAIVALLAIAIIATLVVYLKRKKDIENGHITN